MKLISFDPLRTLGLFPDRVIKPELMDQSIDDILSADGILFPQYWQLNPLVYGLRKRIFPSLPSYHIGHDKVEMSRCFQLVAPAHVPWTLIRANTVNGAEEIWQQMPLPFVAKIPRSSMGEGVFLIETQQQWQDYCERSPVLYAQEYLPIDRDLRIVAVGRDIVGGYWRMQSAQGFYNNLARGGHVRSGPLPVAALELVSHLCQALDIDHGGFDIAMVDGHPFVLEFNRLFGNQGWPGMQADVDAAIQRYLNGVWSDDDPADPVSPNRGGRGSLRQVV